MNNTALFERYESIKKYYPDCRTSYFSPNNTISIANENLNTLVFKFDAQANIVSCNYKEGLYLTGKGTPVEDVALPKDLAEIYKEVKAGMDKDASKLASNSIDSKEEEIEADNDYEHEM